MLITVLSGLVVVNGGSGLMDVTFGHIGKPSASRALTSLVSVNVYKVRYIFQ